MTVSLEMVSRRALVFPGRLADIECVSIKLEGGGIVEPVVSRLAYAGTSLALSFSFLSDRKEELLRGALCEDGLVVEWFRDKADRILLVVSAGRVQIVGMCVEQRIRIGIRDRFV